MEIVHGRKYWSCCLTTADRGEPKNKNVTMVEPWLGVLIVNGEELFLGRFVGRYLTNVNERAFIPNPGELFETREEASLHYANFLLRQSTEAIQYANSAKTRATNLMRSLGVFSDNKSLHEQISGCVARIRNYDLCHDDDVDEAANLLEIVYADLVHLQKMVTIRCGKILNSCNKEKVVEAEINSLLELINRH